MFRRNGLIGTGLATLYSASSIVAMQGGLPNAHFLLRQLSGVAVGAVVLPRRERIP